jgi:hypothetical protein
MAFQVSPGINVSEVDLTAGAQQVSVSDAAFAGPFAWGPALQVMDIGSEDDLVRVFGKPDSTIYEHWYSAQSFLAYSNLLHAVRAVSEGALNATSGYRALPGSVDNAGNNVFDWTADGNSAFTTVGLVVGESILIGGDAFTVNSIVSNTEFTTTTDGGANAVSAATVDVFGALIKNQTEYDANWASGVAFAVDANTPGSWAAKYPGELGNSLKVSVCDSANAFSSTPAGAISLTAGSNTVTGNGTSFQTTVVVGDTLKVGGLTLVVSSIVSNTSLRTGAAASKNVAETSSWTRSWQYASLFDGAPKTSAYASSRGGSLDEVHVVVVDEDGLFTGVPGTVLERYPFLSKASDAKNVNGDPNYYVTVVNAQSKYVWWTQTASANTANWGSVAASHTFGVSALAQTVSLKGGQTDNENMTDGDKEVAFDLFKNKDVVDISLIITGPASASLASYVIQNIAEVRKDCVAFVSPNKSDVVNNSGQEVSAITAHRNQLPSTSYGFLDSGWKWTFDKYNDVNRWVPLNGDIAGIAARSDSATDPWFSPAGFTRGNVKNVIKLAWNPIQVERDDLYKIGVNAVVAFPGAGTVLFGDKTLLDRPSAFDRINVRRLFIVLEKTVSRLSRASLFEFNDDFTRSQFRNAIEPYLRDVKSRRGVTDYRVICDDTNNTAEVIQSNSFVGDIFVKPAYSINFIQLNFTAVPGGVSFQEVTGQVQ